MDPNATLAEIRDAIAEYGEAADDNDQGRAYDALETVAQRFRDLDDWIAKGGFLPSAWVPGPIRYTRDVVRAAYEAGTHESEWGKL